MQDGMFMFALTPLTRNANKDRRIVVKGFDINRRHFYLVLVGLPGAVLLCAVFWPFFGQYALGAALVYYPALFWLVETRTANGLQLRRYQALIDSRVSSTGKFLHCGEVVHPGESVERNLQSASVPSQRGSDEIDVHGTWVDPAGLFTSTSH